MQLVFQDPYASLNPRMRILDILEEPLFNHKIVSSRDEAVEPVKTLLDQVGLPENVLERFPHLFSGGQRQCVVIARALALKPKFIVADEPVSALDVSIRAQVVNLLQDLRTELGLTYLFMAHDLSVVQHVSTHKAIMYCACCLKLDQLTRFIAMASTPIRKRCCPQCRHPTRKLKEPDNVSSIKASHPIQFHRPKVVGLNNGARRRLIYVAKMHPR